MIRFHLSSALALALLLLALPGCGNEDESTTPETPAASSDLPKELSLAAPPADPMNVIAARDQAQAGQEVTVIGKVGGARKVFVDNRALFTLVDVSLRDCYGMQDSCETPWDYCCEDPTKLAQGTATVEFQEGGKPLPTTARGFAGLDHGKTAIVKGTAKKDANGNLTIVASGIYVKP